MVDFNNNYLADYEDSGGFSGDVVSQNKALANIVNPKPAGPSQDVIDALKNQILSQGTSSKWTGKGFGSAEANAADMARILAGIGITDIKQFGPITTTVPGYTTVTEAGEEVVPEQTITTYGNKETGQVVPNTYSERQSGNAWGGTFEGSGNTGYRVQFGPDGTPYFYTTGASSNDLANIMQDLGPVFQIGMALATGGLSIPQQIAANMAVQVLSGQDVGDAIKNAAVNLAVANIPGTDLMKEGNKFISGLGLDTTTTNMLTNSFQNATISGTKALLTGKDVGDAMWAGAATGGVNGAVNALLNSSDMQELTKDMSSTQKRMVANAVTGVISGKPLDQIVINSAIAAANAEAKEQAKYKPLDEQTLSELDPEEKKIYEQSGTKGLMQYNQEQKAKAEAASAQAEEEAKQEEIRVLAERNAQEAARVETENARKIKEAEEAKVAKAVEDARLAKEAEASKAAESSKSLPTVNVTGDKETDIRDFLDLNSPVGRTSDPDILGSVTPKTTLPSAGEVVVKGKADTCPIGTVYNPDTDSCDPIGSEYTPPTKSLEPDLTKKDMGNVVVTGKRDTCPIGTIYNPVTDSCDPYWDETGDPTAGQKVIEQPTMEVVGKRDTCPIGTIYNPSTDSCDPVTSQPDIPQNPVVPPVVPEKPADPAKPVTVKPTTPAPTASAPTSSMPYQEQAPQAPKWVTPDLANVFYYGKDFGSKKQKLNEFGELEQEDYRGVGEPVTAADGGLVADQKNRENNANDALDLILGQSGYSMSVDDLLNIVKGS